MPKYQYACIQCDEEIEKDRAITEKEPVYFCEKCGYSMARVYSPISVTFKGKGFYKTDNR